MTFDRTLRVLCGTILLTAVVNASDALACTCALGGSPCGVRTSPDAVIFVGTTTEISAPAAAVDPATGPASRVVRVRFAVSEAIQGPKTPTAVSSTEEKGSGCGFPFQVGQTYLVYAFRQADGLHTDICSGTGTLSEKTDDLEILREAALGAVRPRLFGTVVFLQSAMNGTVVPVVAGALPAIKIVARKGTERHETTTDSRGTFRFVGLEPGRYTVHPEVALPLKPPFDSEAIVNLDACSAETLLTLTAVSLTGTVRRHDGSPGPRDVKVTVLDAQHRSADHGAVMFTNEGGQWSVDGLAAGRYLVGLNAFEAPSASNPYPTVWYPGVSDVAKAQEIAFLDGRARQLDLTLPPPLRLRTIRGVVRDPMNQVAAGARVTLFDREFPTREVGSATTDAEGRFSVRAVVGRQVSASAASLVAGATVTSETISVPNSTEDETITLLLWQRSPVPERAPPPR
jgi:carboxypeptidase family protein